MLRLPLIGVLLFPAAAAAQTTTRASVDSAGVEGNGDSQFPAVSADGQVVAFTSSATNLVAGDANGVADVFVRDLASGVTERVSVDSGGVEGNGASGFAAISADGQVVAFYSLASNLVASDGNGVADIFVYDRATGVTERVSVDSSGGEANIGSFVPAISADGQVVAFWSPATNLVAGDTLGKIDVFVHDRATGVTERMSVDSFGYEADATSWYPAISGDGNVVAFLSKASNLVGSDDNGFSDIFVHDRTTGVTECVSIDSSGGQGDADCSMGVSLSSDGTMVAFWTAATNLVAGDGNGVADVFVHDRASGMTDRVSVDSSGAEGDAASQSPSLSADGMRVAFTSKATDLVAGDTNGAADVFVHDHAAGTTTRVSVDSTGAQGSGASETPALSADGEDVAFASGAADLVAGDANGKIDVFVHDLCIDPAWSTYGTGFAGTLGVPAWTAQVAPVLGTTVTLDLGNSSGAASVAVVLFGYAQASIPTSKGGTLLVAPAFFVALPLPAAGTTLAGALPDDEALCGFALFTQALEIDPGAARRMSFTAGLELVLGR